MNLNRSLSHINNQWFSKPDAFAFIKKDLENQIRIKKILNLFNQLKKSESKLLDIGCANGFITKEFVKMKYQAYGIDISSKLLKQAKKKEVKVKQIDINNGLSFSNNFFDFIFAGEIIEHIQNTEIIFKEINRVLKKNGQIIITTPNLAHLPDRIKLLKGQAPTQIQPLHKYLKLHIRQFTHSSLNQILRSYGFKIIKSQSTIVVFKRNLKDLDKVTKYSKILANLFPSFGASIIIQAQKKSSI